MNAVLECEWSSEQFHRVKPNDTSGATASICSPFSIALIPFIASRIVRGDVGSTMMTMVSAMTTTAGAVGKFGAQHRSLVSEKVQPPLMQRVEEHLRPHRRHPVGQEVRCQERHLRHFPQARPRVAVVPPVQLSPRLRLQHPHLPSGSMMGVLPHLLAEPVLHRRLRQHLHRPRHLLRRRGAPRVAPANIVDSTLRMRAAWYVGYSLGSAYRGLKGRE